MKLKVEYGKMLVLKKLRTISNNVVVNNFINELINHGSITNFFYDEIGCVYTFENKNNEKIFIYFGSNRVIADSSIDGIYQQFEFNKNIMDGSSSIYLKVSARIEWPAHISDRTASLYALYDCNSNLISYKTDINKVSMGSDEVLSEKLKNWLYEDYSITSIIEVVGDKLLKKEMANYLCDYDKNSTVYCVGKYDLSLFDNIYSFGKSKFVEISEREYGEFKKNSAQKIKTMV